MPDTPLIGLPLLEASQAQKHVTHNEALLLLDAMLHLAVISRALATPPASPGDGDRYLVAASATARGWAIPGISRFVKRAAGALPFRKRAGGFGFRRNPCSCCLMERFGLTSGILICWA